MPTRTLKVLVLDQAPGVWGAQRYVLRLAPLLQQSGVEMVLAGPRSLELHELWQQAGFAAVQLDLAIERSIRADGRPALAALAHESCAGVKMARLIANLVRAGDY